MTPSSSSLPAKPETGALLCTLKPGSESGDLHSGSHQGVAGTQVCGPVDSRAQTPLGGDSSIPISMNWAQVSLLTDGSLDLGRLEGTLQILLNVEGLRGTGATKI